MPIPNQFVMLTASNYNLVLRPVVILIDKRQVRRMERQKTYADLLARYAGV